MMPMPRARIERIETFLVNVECRRSFSFGEWRNRQHVFLRSSSGDESGWGEALVAVNAPEFDLDGISCLLAEIVGLSLDDAFQALVERRGKWKTSRLEAAETALIDLAARLAGMPALEFLELEGRQSVPAMFCILESDPEQVRAKARLALDQGMRTHLKLKIFGDVVLDDQIVRAAREMMGPSAMIVADANLGYEKADLTNSLRRLHKAGLTACEDPARLEPDEWVALQNEVGELDLIPDAPMKIAWKAVDTIRSGMGRVYNIHPDNAGSLVEACRLGRRIHELDARLMIGDDSLVGPGCAAWQHLAIGLGAVWVEAMEKPQECRTYLDAVIDSALHLSNGQVGYAKIRPGFGQEVDLPRLRSSCHHRRVLGG